AKKRISQLDIDAYGRKAKRYVENKTFTREANEEMRLYNATMKINRLELLKANIGLELVDGFDELQKYFDTTLTDRSLSEFKRQAGILGESVLNNEKAAHSIVNASFRNAKFSDRIWMYQDMLKAELSSQLKIGLIQGRNPRQLARHISKVFGVSRNNAERLMQTELARVQTEAQKQSYERNGYDKYVFIAEPTACPVCQALDDKVFEVGKMMPGTNASPMHPNCRCSTAAYADREVLEARLAEIEAQEHKIQSKGIVKSGKDDTIKLKDIIIHRSVGAKARNYKVVDKTTGIEYEFAPGTHIQNAEVFAGKGTKHPLHDGVPEGLTEEYGGDVSKWQHVKGEGVLVGEDTEEEYPAEVHWFQEESVGKVKFKVKRWLDES
ncbi:minor capsid protein, partial [Muricomes intestini]